MMVPYIWLIQFTVGIPKHGVWGIRRGVAYQLLHAVSSTRVGDKDDKERERGEGVHLGPRWW